MELDQDYMISKTFVFENELNTNSENLDVLLRADLEQININEVITIFLKKNSIHHSLVFRIYDPEINHYVPLDPHKPISRSFIYTPVIMIKYKQAQSHLDSDKDSMASSKASSQTKRQRNRERTIRDVLLYVKQWRQIHNTLDKHNNKINLQDAAKMVGISKKSLDDYFCQLRLAEEYGFDFESNFEEKIGVLRAFVKKFRPKGDLGLKHQRLPKKLKIIQEMGEQHALQKKESQQKMVAQQQQQGSELLMQAQYQPPMAIIPEDEYQNRFYNSFNFTLDEFDDPFVSFGHKNNQGSFQVQPQSSLF